ncbi:MAG: hypothetical protein V1929_01535 [bacterium]
MLHITNGDEAARRIRETGVPGDILSWSDALHEGPVPAGVSPKELRELRAKFIGQQGWSRQEDALADFTRRDERFARAKAEDEMVFWFEHDLCDQLQLLQALNDATLPAPGVARLSVIQTDDYLTALAPKDLAARFPARQAVSAMQVELAHKAWKAFRSTDATAIAGLLQQDTSALPHLDAALLRHLEEFPSVSNGLSRSEAQALEGVDSGKKTLKEAFTAAHHDREERMFMRDTIFASCLERLSKNAKPLVVLENGNTVVAPRRASETDAFWRSRAKLTDTGRDVLACDKDWVKLHKMDRWLGGVRLLGNRVPWRWNDAAHELQEEEEEERHGWLAEPSAHETHEN